MIIRRVLIVAKRSAYQAYFNEYQERPLRRLAKKGDKALLHIRRSHDAHYRTLEHVKDVLKRRGIETTVRFRGQPVGEGRYDLVISVGGDGSFLEASHAVGRGIILGVNSDTGHSVGNFCRAHAGNFERRLDALLRGTFTSRRLSRLRVKINGRPAGLPVLNDFLVCHACPASMSHYILKAGPTVEPQRSSGLWVATAAGSSGAARSAGGRVLKIDSRRIQYVPRELFSWKGQRYRLRGGVIPGPQGFSIVSQMKEGRIYLDGAHHPLPFEYGDRLTVVPAPALRMADF